MSATVNVHEAKTQLSQLLARVERGEEVTIARAGKPVARLVGVKPTEKRRLGAMAGQWVLPDCLLEPTSDEIIDLFEKGEIFPE